MIKVLVWIRRAIVWVDRKILFKGLVFVNRAAGRQAAIRAERYNADPESRWKEQALADFQVWLTQVESLPENGPLAEEMSCDLYSLLAEFLSLKKQIEIQNREQSKHIRALKGFNTFSGQGSEILARLGQQIDRLDKMEADAREAGRTDALICFLDVRDTLVRGGGAVAGKTGFFSSGRKQHKNLVQGYEMALRKLDQALATLETFPIDTRDCEFDPAVMTAVETRPAGTGRPGMVVDEVSGGFIRKDRLIRPAQVIVSK